MAQRITVSRGASRRINSQPAAKPLVQEERRKGSFFLGMLITATSILICFVVGNGLVAVVGAIVGILISCKTNSVRGFVGAIVTSLVLLVLICIICAKKEHQRNVREYRDRMLIGSPRY